MTKAQLNQLTLEQLRTLNEQVVKAIKAKRKDIIAESEIKVGDKVKVNHPKLQGKSLIVREIKRTTATLQLETGYFSYKVPIVMIEK
jgi:transcription antitermination factor NusG